MIPKLAINSDSQYNEDYFQITNISPDYRSFDFMNQRVSIYNVSAAQIIRDRTNPDYYKDIDFDITPDELDKFDRECITHGEMLLKYHLSTPEQITPTRPYPPRYLNWLELDRLAKGEENMTRLELESLMHDVYGISLNTVLKDKAVLEKHREIEKLKHESDEDDTMIVDDKVIVLVKYQDDIIKSIKDSDDLEALKAQVIATVGDINNINNYMYVKDLEKKAFDRELETREMEALRQYIIEISKLLNIPFKDKKVYKGVLGLVMTLGFNYGAIISDYRTMEAVMNLE